jgi:protein-tyrosine phosphatase
LAREPELIRQQGLQYCNYPIPDLGVPSSRESARNLLKQMYRELLAGRKIGIHCRGSIGRAGLIASGILVLAGVEPSNAIREVSKARQVESPETAEQREWVKTISQEPVSSRA